MFDNRIVAALLTFGICGVIGVLIDLDHLIKHKGRRNTKLLHKSILIGSIVTICIVGAYLGRLLVE